MKIPHFSAKNQTKTDGFSKYPENTATHGGDVEKIASKLAKKQGKIGKNGQKIQKTTKIIQRHAY